MTVSREAAMVALFSQVSSATLVDGITPAFVLSSRRIKLWGDVSATDKPCMFLIETHETRTQQPPQGLPSKLLLRAKAVIYTVSQSPNIVPSTQMNLMLDAVERALAPDDVTRNVFTLGGLVYRCWVEGDIVKTPGDLDGEGMAIVPINIMLP